MNVMVMVYNTVRVKFINLPSMGPSTVPPQPAKVLQDKNNGNVDVNFDNDSPMGLV
jgi:hypothetical protein